MKETLKYICLLCMLLCIHADDSSNSVLGTVGFSLSMVILICIVACSIAFCYWYYKHHPNETCSCCGKHVEEAPEQAVPMLPLPQQGVVYPPTGMVFPHPNQWVVYPSTHAAYVAQKY